MLFIKKRNQFLNIGILFSLICALLVILNSNFSFALQAYGDGAYSECKYSEGCDVSPDSTIVPVPASESNPNEGRVFAVNIKNGQVFRQSKYQVRVTPNFSADQILKVVLLQDGVEVATAYDISGESYLIIWDVPERGNHKLQIKIYLNDGKEIENTFNVSATRQVEAGTTKNENSSGSEVTRSNKVGFFQPVLSFIDRLIASVPRPVAYLIPFGLILAISLILMVLLIQTKNQLRFIFIMIDLLKKDKLLFEEKATFIKLVSHHIRTPMTILKGGVEVYQLENPKTELSPALISVQKLSKESEELLSDTQQNKQLQKISSPDIEESIGLLYKSWKLILPMMLSFILIVLLNYLFISAGKTELIIPNILVQIILALATVIGLLVILQKRKNNITQHRHIERQHKYQFELDKARNNFIKQSASKITPLLISAKQSCQKVIPAVSRKNIDEAFSRLGSLLERFNLASELERGKIEAAFTNVQPKELLESAFSVKKSDIKSKNLETSILGSQIRLIQNEYLLLYVLSALIDNAVSYADKDTKIEATFKSIPKNQVSISIKDKGLTIDEDKIESLFKPFSRSDDVVQFDKQGAGINLYLSRLISKYLGGDISLKSDSNKQTTAILSLPNKLII